MAEGKGALVDSGLLEPFVQATRSVFEKQMGFELKVSPPCTGVEQKPPVDIAAVVRLNNSHLEGEFGIFFDQATVIEYHELAVGIRHPDLVPEIKDTAFEILNMVYSNARASLLLKGVRFERHFPTVLCGEDLQKYVGKSKNPTIVSFVSPFGKFYLEMGFGK